MNKKIIELIDLIKEDLGLFLSISFGVFLFVLFFQPFPTDRFDFNNKLLFVAGMSGIIFLIMMFVRIVIPWLIKDYAGGDHEYLIHSYMVGFIIFIFSSVAFAFYIRFVGFVEISFYIMFKVAFICLAPPVILRLYDTLSELRLQNESLIRERKTVQKQVEKFEKDYLNKTIRFVSENNTDELNLTIANVALIKSADNYVEIIYKEDDQFKKKLLRNTLKNIEQQTKTYSNFIRCHRICVVNTHFIEKLNRNYNNHWLTIKGFNEQIPVSRQYLLKLKEIL